MKHVMISSAWSFGVDPFSAFRCNLVYGRNKRDREFLAVKDVLPIIQYTVRAPSYAGSPGVLYDGHDSSAAETVKAQYDAEPKQEAFKEFPVGVRRPHWDSGAEIKKTLPILPDGKFRVIKTQEKGTILVVPGSDDTNRCLLFVGCEGGFRGGVSTIKDGTTGTILKECSAGNACESSCEVIVILEVGQSVVFHTSGRRTNEVYLYTWNGTEVEKKHFSKSEWDSRNVVAMPVENAEVL